MDQSRYKLDGKPGDWEIWLCKPITGDKLELVDRVANRGHALTILKGLENPQPRRVRYTWRKVYRYLKAMGWRIELNEPPAVWWVHQGGGQRVKENRQLSARELLLSCYRNVPGDDKETLQAYWTWHKQHANL